MATAKKRRSDKVDHLRQDAALNRERLLAAAEQVFASQGTSASLEDVARAAKVGPATLYRRFASKDALVREVLTSFFSRLIELARQAEAAPPEKCIELFLETVGWELADKAGFTHTLWGELSPWALIDELAELADQLLRRAQQSGAIHASVTHDDIAAAVWALRGVVQASRTADNEIEREAWRRHLAFVLAGFRVGVGATPAAGRNAKRKQRK